MLNIGQNDQHASADKNEGKVHLLSEEGAKLIDHIEQLLRENCDFVGE